MLKTIPFSSKIKTNHYINTLILAIYAYVYQYRHYSGTLITTMTAYIANINHKTI